MSPWAWVKQMWADFMLGYRRGKLRRAIRTYGEAVSKERTR